MVKIKSRSVTRLRLSPAVPFVANYRLRPNMASTSNLSRNRNLIVSPRISWLHFEDVETMRNADGMPKATAYILAVHWTLTALSAKDPRN